MKKAVFFLLIIVLGFGCKKENSFNFSSNLIGKWSWFSTCPGTIRIGCLTPDSLHPTYDIAFTSKSIYNVYFQDTLKFSSRFHTDKSVSEDGKYTTYFIKYDSGSQDMYSIIHDTLTLVNWDGFLTMTSSYKRISK